MQNKSGTHFLDKRLDANPVNVVSIMFGTLEYSDAIGPIKLMGSRLP